LLLKVVLCCVLFLQLRQPTDIRPLQEQQHQQQLQAALGLQGMHAAAGPSEAALTAAFAGNYQVPGAAAAAMQPHSWQLQMHAANLADQLVRATSNTSVMSSTVSAGPASPSAALNSPAAAAAAAAAGGNMHHLLRNLVHDANSTRQQLAAAQQQLQAMATGAACMPLPVQKGGPGMAAGMMPQLSLPQQTGTPNTSAGNLYVSASGYMAMDCTEGMSNACMDLSAVEPSACSSASLSELSATLPLLTAEQMAQLQGANTAAGTPDGVLLRSGSSISSGGPPMQWGQQLAAAAAAGQGGAGMQSRLALQQLAGGAPGWGGQGPTAHMMQQQQQQLGIAAAKWQQQQQLAGQGSMMMQMHGADAIGQQQQQAMPGQYGYPHGAAPATHGLQGPAGAPLYFMQ
jgi:hypothetical protein